ncbi:MAG: hypothetical protein ACYDHP_02320 [Ferrimicrobium sp.]
MIGDTIALVLEWFDEGEPPVALGAWVGYGSELGSVSFHQRERTIAASDG